uniref:Uncharacterized protein n=1 Tax=Anguilla anguilla TaxID=7936 RepID=A0A0E9UE65_ANGAN
MVNRTDYFPSYSLLDAASFVS